MLALRKRNPDFSYKFFTNEKVFQYVLGRVPTDVAAKLRGMDPLYNVVYADLFRYLVMYDFGGVYLDAKSTINGSFADLIKPEDEILFFQWANGIGAPQEGYGLHTELSRVPGGEFVQWVLMTQPKHPIMRHVLQTVFHNILNYSPNYFGVGRIGVLRTTGPIAFTQAVAPMLPNYPFRCLDLQKTDLVYSIFGETWSPNENGEHYSNQTHPIFPKLDGWNRVVFKG